MKRALLILLSAFSLMPSAFAANWFCRTTAQGNGSGSSWSNARNLAGINAGTNISGGDTVWIAGGSYGAFAPNKTGTSGAQYYYRRARTDSSDCTNAAGWSAAFDSTVVLTGISFDTDDAYCTISGRTVASGGGYGLKIDRSAFTSGMGINFTGGSDNITIEYFEAVGAGNITVTGDMRAIDMTPSSGTASTNTFSHWWIHDWESGAYCVAGAAPVFEYGIMEDIMVANWSSFHPNGIIIWACPNGIIRYCTFRKGPNGFGCGEGTYWAEQDGHSGWWVYGNTYEHLNSTGWKAIEVTSEAGPLNVLNNTFIDCLFNMSGGANTGGNWKNNLYYSASPGSLSGQTVANNVTASGTGVFVNYAAADLHIVAGSNAENAGQALTTDGFINVDRDGVQRGGDGTWDVGAYEVASGGGGDTTPPVLSNIAAGGISQTAATITWTTDESATSGVKYGLTSSYGSTVTNGNVYALSQSLALSGLTANTTYHYQPWSSDVAGNTASNVDLTFTTANIVVNATTFTITGQ